MHYSLDYVQRGDGTAVAIADEDDWATGVSRNSNIGVKGSEDLGNGLKAIFKIENQINQAVGFRNTYVGLSGDFGTVLMGRHDTPYKISTGSLDLFGDTVGDYNAVIGTHNGALAFDERAPQTVAYISPNMNGLTLAAALVSVTVDEGALNDETQAASLAAMYSNGPIFASLAYETFEDGAAALGQRPAVAPVPAGLGHGTNVAATTNTISEAWKLGLGYKMDNFSLGFVWEDITGNSGTFATNRGQENWMLNGSYAMGNNVFKVQYAEADRGGVGTDYSTWALGLDHNMSKRTKVYGMYATIDNASASTATLYNGDGADQNYGGTVAGGDADVVSVGIQHSF
jgi:predicted porin